MHEIDSPVNNSLLFTACFQPQAGDEIPQGEKNNRIGAHFGLQTEFFYQRLLQLILGNGFPQAI